MEFKQIQELIKTINKSNIDKIKIKDGEFEITIQQQSNNAEMPVVTYSAPAVQAPAPVMQVPIAAPAPQAPAPSVPAAPAPEAETPANTIVIKSPMIGTFYRSSAPDKPPFVGVGDEVKAGSVVCIIEAMKLFNEIESEVSGKIVKVLVDDASPVEYDQPLFLVEP